MARLNNFLVTRKELGEAAILDNLFLIKSSIPNDDKCITTAEAKAYVHLDESNLSTNDSKLPRWQDLLPKRATNIVVEMDQIGSPYMNTDVFASQAGTTFRLDPNNNLDGLYFGGPQTSPNIGSQVKIGVPFRISFVKGLNTLENGVSYGWERSGYAVYERWENDVMVYRDARFYNSATGPNSVTVNYDTIIQNNTKYLFKCYAVPSYSWTSSFSPDAQVACSKAGDCTNFYTTYGSQLEQSIVVNEGITSEILL